MAEVYFDPDEPVIVLGVTIQGPRVRERYPLLSILELLLQ